MIMGLLDDLSLPSCPIGCAHVCWWRFCKNERKATEELLMLNPWPSPNSPQPSGVCLLKRVIAKWRCLGLVEISSIYLHFSRRWWQWWLWYGMILLGQRSLLQDTPHLVAQVLFLGFSISSCCNLCIRYIFAFCSHKVAAKTKKICSHSSPQFSCNNYSWAMKVTF
jgi:hypothetical protein